MEVFVVKMDDYFDVEFGYPQTTVLGVFYSQLRADHFVGVEMDKLGSKHRRRVYFYVERFVIGKDA